MTLSLLAAIAVLTFGLTGCADVPEPESAPELVDEPTDVEWAEQPDALVEARCSVSCHGLDTVEAADYDEAGWRAAIERHDGRGLEITAEEREIIVEHLASQ